MFAAGKECYENSSIGKAPAFVRDAVSAPIKSFNCYIKKTLTRQEVKDVPND